jgi:uncharacterized protein YejL (UPF0352 family)
MPQPLLTLEDNIRSMRIVYVTILLAMTMQVLVAERLSHQAPRDIHVIWLGFLVTGLTEVGIALFFRIRMLQPAAETLQEKPDDQTAVARWRVGNILSFVILDSVLLYGVALRFLGGTTWQSLPFYFVGIALMLAWWPRRP